jgi:hypothetical protein
MATYTLISSNVLSSSAASVTFSSIPATFTDLVLIISARSNNGAASDAVNITFNGNTSAVYSQTQLMGFGSGGVASTNGSGLSRNYYRYIDGNGSTADTYGSMEIYIPSYLVSQNKPIGVFGVQETNAAAANMAVVAALFSSTAAISSLTVKPEDGSLWLSTSSFYLYGISNA